MGPTEPGRAPDLFTALELEPATATVPVTRDDAPPSAGLRAVTPTIEPITPAAPPVVRVVAPPIAASLVASPPPPRPASPSPSPVPPPRPAVPSRRPAEARAIAPPGVRPSGPVAGGLADLLEPGEADVSPFEALRAADSLIAGRPVNGPATGADLPLVPLEGFPPPGAAAARGEAVDPRTPSWDPPPPRGRGMGMMVGLGALSLMLAAALGWVLYTQTDIFEGDVVERRDARAQAEAEAELEQAKAEAAAKTRELGTVTIDSAPQGARVFMLRDGPTATFEHLPADGEYMIAVMAEGHVPRVRVVKGSELTAPVIMDLDPVEEGAPTPVAIPQAEVPKVGRDAKTTVTLELRSNTPAATLALLVGYTPGVTLVDLDVAQAHRFLVTLPDHEAQELVVKGRHFEEQGDALVYDTVVELSPRAPEPEPSIAIDDDDG